MTLTISLTPEEEARLRAAAVRRGVDPSECAKQLLAQYLPPLSPNEETAGDGGEDLLAGAIAGMTGRTSDEVSQAQTRAAEFIRPGKPLAPGQTVVAAVSGKWPGDESDDQVTEALRKLS